MVEKTLFFLRFFVYFFRYTFKVRGSVSIRTEMKGRKMRARGQERRMK